MRIRISRIMVENKVRFIIQDRETFKPMVAISIYEAFLSSKGRSHNTSYDAIQKFSYIFFWANLNNIDIDSILLSGEMIQAKHVNTFGAWLCQIGKLEGKAPLKPATINSILTRTSLAFRWFADQYVTLDCRSSEREIYLNMYKDSIAKRFSDQNLNVRSNPIADDLTEEEIIKIEHFLKPENRLRNNPKISPAQALRDYIIWRLIIEFGLREGEILALRLEDCPHQHENNIKIIRIEERGSSYVDPRGGYAPRPKTLSRELGFILKNSPLPKLINDYITKYRRRIVTEHGKKKIKPILDIPAFLILSHQHGKGTPLSISALQDIASEIRKGTGLEKFHWHIGRHAFFNRVYEFIIDLKEKDGELFKDRLKDLVYWGGWECELSLQIYINRARRHRAQTALSLYQVGGNEWEALK